MTSANTFPLELVLTAEGFVPELPAGASSEEARALLAEWENDRWAALYHLGLQERPAGLSQSALYLYTVAEGFSGPSPSPSGRNTLTAPGWNRPSGSLTWSLPRRWASTAAQPPSIWPNRAST